jgi:hypothetical protein
MIMFPSKLHMPVSLVVGDLQQWPWLGANFIYGGATQAQVSISKVES